MAYDMGKKIRELRLKRNMTQEALASALNLSAQAVSKWENGTTQPDIQLLPELSVLFGTSIDDLFSLSEETHFDRIENLLTVNSFPPAAEYDAAETFLLERMKDSKHGKRALTLLASLNNHRADGYRQRAELFAKHAIEIDPYNKQNHSLLCAAFGGVVWDWCVTNHHEQISYYQDFVKKHPAYARGYQWLLENLLADNRLDEIEPLLDQLRRIEDSHRYLLYRGHLAAARGDMAAAERDWAEMVEQYPDPWLSWTSRGDGYARYGLYDKAIENYRQSIQRQHPPRYTDNELSIAQIATITGDWTMAVDSYTRVLEILRDDWGQTEGDGIDRISALIAEAKRKASD